MQVLYEDDLNPGRSVGAADLFLQRRLRFHRELVDFARGLVSGVRRNRRELDQALARVAANWSLNRMAVTDRNVLRLGAYEILCTETPGPVVINEAVEIAKRYGARQSPHFVNGILDRLLQENRGRHDRRGKSED